MIDKEGEEPYGETIGHRWEKSMLSHQQFVSSLDMS